MWGTTKHTKIAAMRVGEGQKSEKGSENLFKEIVTENFPNCMKKIIKYSSKLNKFQVGYMQMYTLKMLKAKIRRKS